MLPQLFVLPAGLLASIYLDNPSFSYYRKSISRFWAALVYALDSFALETIKS